MVAIGSNFFYTVTLPVTLWFLDKAKAGTPREDTVLFLDARHIFRQIDRAHRDFLPEQIEFLANIVRLYRGEDVETIDGSDALLKEHFPDGTYVDVAGLCKVATRAEIEAQGWSLNPGRYTGTAAVDDERRRLHRRRSRGCTRSSRASATKPTCCARRSTRRFKGSSTHERVARRDPSRTLGIDGALRASPAKREHVRGRGVHSSRPATSIGRRRRLHDR